MVQMMHIDRMLENLLQNTLYKHFYNNFFQSVVMKTEKDKHVFFSESSKKQYLSKSKSIKKNLHWYYSSSISTFKCIP